ncbi:MAG: D-alanyl-D-alanine carboxypeptidase [Cereibacter sphaeroides]|uniref:D-alanyl-D-alanine carboxypeptidase n=1 Tax=Cereibacter sphaeroides TaxID=1063 RepID=A0A2W5SEY0_CERSP|nr:MAG: D-alanyl-D-alanine carboxypeptidase [Cereibacter sphaeroides]
MFALAFALVAAAPGIVRAAPYAALVMDARTGEVLYETNADARLHPASLTKMLTLYITFQAIERGEISLDTMVKVSKNAASEPPSKLGLKAGQKIQLRYLIRAAAVKSANDAATAIGEAVGGSEEAFAARMNRTAKALGMKNSTFKNANGLTAPGHLSTARDLTVLGRRLFYDFPQYYNIFSRRSTDAGMATVANTNRRFLDSYRGADGIKTGYTNPAGFNLTASAERDGKRLIATVMGGKSTAHRNAKMAELLDLGFGAAPSKAAVTLPTVDMAAVAEDDANEEGGSAKTLRVVGAITKSPRPLARPAAAPSDEMLLAMQDSIAGALAEATEVPAAQVAAAQIEEPAPPSPDTNEAVALAVLAEPAAAEEPVAEGEDTSLAGPEVELAALEPEAEEGPSAEELATAAQPTGIVTLAASTAPRARPDPEQMFADAAPAALVPTAPEVVTRISTSGGRQWGINVGRFPSRARAESQLLKTGLAETATLNDGLRKVVERSGGYDATFVGLTQDQADLACRRLQAREVQCFTMGP